MRHRSESGNPPSPWLAQYTALSVTTSCVVVWANGSGNARMMRVPSAFISRISPYSSMHRKSRHRVPSGSPSAQLGAASAGIRSGVENTHRPSSVIYRGPRVEALAEGKGSEGRHDPVASRVMRGLAARDYRHREPAWSQ